MIKKMLGTSMCVIVALLLTSCHKEEADFTIYVGDTFSFGLNESTTNGEIWVWENEDKTDIVSMTKYYGTPYDTTVSANAGVVPISLAFTGKKEGFAEIHLARQKGTEKVGGLFFTVKVESSPQ